jgi:uncharacterized membrane protein YfcA
MGFKQERLLLGTSESNVWVRILLHLCGSAIAGAPLGWVFKKWLLSALAQRIDLPVILP